MASILLFILWYEPLGCRATRLPQSWFPEMHCSLKEVANKRPVTQTQIGSLGGMHVSQALPHDIVNEFWGHVHGTSLPDWGWGCLGTEISPKGS